MSHLNRSAITITRKQPYADWAIRQAQAEAEAEGESDPDPFTDDVPRTVYMVGPAVPVDDVGELLDDFWQDIFEEELAAWSEDSTTWPEPRTRDLFDTWFDAEITDTVVDLTPDEALSEEELELAAVADALAHCAWCDLEIEPNEGRHVGIQVPNRERVASREGSVLVLLTKDDQPLAGILTTPDSPEAAAGDDLIFRACTSRCEKLIRKEAPRALRRLVDHLAAR